MNFWNKNVIIFFTFFFVNDTIMFLSLEKFLNL